MRQLKRFYQEVYKYDSEHNSYQIDVLLDAYEDVYDEWDASPFKRRDIEDEFDDFITDSSSDIPLKYGVVINLYLPKNAYDERKERLLVEAYENFYQFKLKRALKVRQNMNRKILNYLVLAIIFLFVGYFYLPEEEGILFKLVKEGIFIGGWVFLWEVFTLLFISESDQTREVKLIKRLLMSNLNFIYIE